MKRSKWKGIFINLKSYQEKKTILKKRISRSSTIVPSLIGKTFKVHNGKNYREIIVTKEMLDHKFGEFFPTRSTFEFKKKKKKKNNYLHSLNKNL